MIENPTLNKQINSFISLLLFLFGILLIPSITEVTIAFSKLNTAEIYQLKFFSVLFLFFSILLLIFRKRIHENVSLIFISFFLLIGIEIGFRLFIIFFISGTTQDHLIKQSNWTFNEYAKFKGHPFLQFNGTTSTENGNEFQGLESHFNNYGFSGKDFLHTPIPGTKRIACIGESTTEDGYPSYLEKYLNENGIKSEVLNFGHSFWTSAHSLINYMLVVSDFHPDIIIINHGWNEHMIRNTTKDKFKNDYSHTLISYTEPFVWDKYIIRISALYRYLKFMNNEKPIWIDLSGYIQDKKNIVNSGFQNQDELIPFERNITAIAKNGILNGAIVYIATIPYSTDEKALFYNTHLNIQQCNKICKKIAETNKIPLIDLDSLMTGKMNQLFKDLAHTDEKGKKMKAKLIGDFIIADTVYQNTPFTQ